MPKRIEHKIENGQELKWCYKCQQWLSLSQFRLNNIKWDKLDAFCRECAKKVNEDARRKVGIPEKEQIFKTIDGLDYKLCSECKTWKLVSDYRKTVGSASGLQSKCKECCRKEHQEHKEERNEYSRKYKVEHKEQIKEAVKKYREKNLKVIREKTNRYVLRKYHTEYKYDIGFRINYCVKSGIVRSLKNLKIKNGRPTEEILIEYLGYDYQMLRDHLALQFEPWMSLDNYGKGEDHWVIDHIDPINGFNITSLDCEDFKQCWKLENLRPFRDVENSSKNNRPLSPLEYQQAKEKAKWAAQIVRDRYKINSTIKDTLADENSKADKSSGSFNSNSTKA